METNLTTLTLTSAINKLKKREISALDLTESCLRIINQLDTQVNAFITTTPEMAVQAALQADSIISIQPPNLLDLPLLGLPIALKDLYDTAGIRTTAGSKFFIDHTPGEDAEAVIRLKLAGAVIIGKTNTHEIALGVTGVNPVFGAVKNPWDLTRISGGSSSGSAAATLCGMCLAALGTDTGGSIRIPASLCGIVGMKPTFGRVSTHGIFPLSWNLDHAGTLTRTVRDSALLLQVLAGYDPHDPASIDVVIDDLLTHVSEDIRTWRIAMAEGEYFERCDPEIMAGLKEAALTMKNLGARVEKVDMSWLHELARANSSMTQADAAAFHHERMEAHPDWFGEDVMQRLKLGAELPSRTYILARKTQVEGRRRFEMFFSKYDLLILPTTPTVAPAIENTGAIEAARQLTRFTAPFNLAGLPALSIPCGFKDGLPFGLQLVSGPWQERKVLQAGHAFEQMTEWHKRFPDLIRTQ
jgi:aspartyl-tRNA(Asn)/glutamyl-tRNA(Gln) amidotransferase subunit A